MKYSIGYRTIKTAFGAAIAIMIAQQIGLHSFLSAGILTILCIQATKVKTLSASWARFFACLLAMPFSVLFFEGITYHPIMIGLLLLLFIPTLVMLKAKDGIVTSSVIILHIYSAGHVTTELLLNEFGVIVTGIGVALIMNLYMPSVDRKLQEYKNTIELNFKVIFCEIVCYLRTNNSSWDGKEITESARLLDEAKTLAFMDFENHFLRNENHYFKYFNMREKQFGIIERVLPIVTSLKLTVEQGEMIANFIEELAENIHSGNTALFYIEKLLRMKVEFTEMELPKTREEFEARAALVQLINELHQYLIIKSSFRGMKNSHQSA